jgi:hypothetical protein
MEVAGEMPEEFEQWRLQGGVRRRKRSDVELPGIFSAST